MILLFLDYTYIKFAGKLYFLKAVKISSVSWYDRYDVNKFVTLVQQQTHFVGSVPQPSVSTRLLS